MFFKLHILGCGSASPTSNYNPTAQWLQMADRHFLIDCGEGTQQQIRRSKLHFGRLNHIFISHLHGDHYFGLFGLLSTFHLLNRKTPLHLYGPPALHEVLVAQQRASQTDLVYPLHFHPTQNKSKALLFEDKRISVYSFPLRHSIASTGFLFVEKPRQRHMIADKIDEFGIPHYAINGIKDGNDYTTESGETIPNSALTTAPPRPLSYAFCSDTAYSPKTTEYVAGVDLLYHESTFLEEDAARAKKTQHSTAVQAAKVAHAAKARHLLIGHYSARVADINLFKREAETIFKPVIAAQQSMRIIASADEIKIEQ